LSHFFDGCASVAFAVCGGQKKVEFRYNSCRTRIMGIISTNMLKAVK
jgi:hypothetical protein